MNPFILPIVFGRMSFAPLSLPEVQAAFDGKFAIESGLQSGGQGAVFRARADNSGTLALKIYYADQLEERLDREIEALKKLRGPTLVELHDAGSCVIRGQHCRYIAMTFIEGRPLDEVIAAEGAQPIDRCARIGHDVALAIEQLWSARIVHRDIKPNNVMLTASGGAILIDLGVARHIDMTSLTTTGKTWGTLGYMSPEQALVSPLTCKSDVFALGILLQECILGRHPTSRRQELLLGGGANTNALRTGLPREFAACVDAMVHRQALHRPAPAKVALELRALAGVATKEIR